jgi:hypothetical protein
VDALVKLIDLQGIKQESEEESEEESEDEGRTEAEVPFSEGRARVRQRAGAADFRSTTFRPSSTSWPVLLIQLIPLGIPVFRVTQ